jgi:hypothetical protein
MLTRAVEGACDGMWGSTRWPHAVNGEACVRAGAFPRAAIAPRDSYRSSTLERIKKFVENRPTKTGESRGDVSQPDA